jgi:hypothetical protein
MAGTPFKLRSGNTTPFKQMGSSSKSLDVARKTSDSVINAGFAHDIGSWMKNKSSTISNISKHIPKVVKGAGRLASKAFLPLTIAESLYSFGKTSVERKKAGSSGFNLQKHHTPKKNKGFNL